MKYLPIVVGYGGIALIWYGTNWQTALGVWLCAAATYADMQQGKRR